MTSPVADHYAAGNLRDRILAALKAAGKDLGSLSVDDLAPVDAFHIRGRAATEELAGHAAISPREHVLDVGCGLGGTARYLADRHGCRVTGVDLTPEYVEVATFLSETVGMVDRTRFETASALELPFEDAAFDVVWTEHVQMNIADKAGFYRELSRVLKPGGRLAFHDIFAGSSEEIEFPVPWARTPEISHLAGTEAIRPLLDRSGLHPVLWEDRTADSVRFFQGVTDRVAASGWMPVGLHLLMGEDAPLKFTNMRRNLEAGRLAVIQAVLEKLRR